MPDGRALRTARRTCLPASHASSTPQISVALLSRSSRPPHCSPSLSLACFRHGRSFHGRAAARHSHRAPLVASPCRDTQPRRLLRLRRATQDGELCFTLSAIVFTLGCPRSPPPVRHLRSLPELAETNVRHTVSLCFVSLSSPHQFLAPAIDSVQTKNYRRLSLSPMTLQ